MYKNPGLTSCSCYTESLCYHYMHYVFSNIELDDFPNFKKLPNLKILDLSYCGLPDVRYELGEYLPSSLVNLTLQYDCLQVSSLRMWVTYVEPTM